MGQLQNTTLKGMMGKYGSTRHGAFMSDVQEAHKMQKKKKVEMNLFSMLNKHVQTGGMSHENDLSSLLLCAASPLGNAIPFEGIHLIDCEEPL